MPKYLEKFRVSVVFITRLTLSMVVISLAVMSGDSTSSRLPGDSCDLFLWLNEIHSIYVTRQGHAECVSIYLSLNNEQTGKRYFQGLML